MKELEKILNEIEEEICAKEKPYDSKETQRWLNPPDKFNYYIWDNGMRDAKKIIEKYLDENDGWIPVEERLPEEFGKYWATTRHNDGRISEPVVVDFRGIKEKYVVDTPNGREYETWGIDSAFHGSRVIAWMQYYIPEAYKPERS